MFKPERRFRMFQGLDGVSEACDRRAGQINPKEYSYSQKDKRPSPVPPSDVTDWPEDSIYSHTAG